MVHQGVSVETASCAGNGGEDLSQQKRLRWYHDNEKATKSPQDMVRESALFQADGGAGCETNEHATAGRISRGRWRAEDGGRSDDGKGRPEMQRAQGSTYRPKLFRVAAVGASLSFLQRWSFLQKAHTPGSAAKPFWALGRR
ncbi:hypothetical protein HDV64DRAFT_64927 [Trichoderma sp. TUCIM 5745]